ncbi:hypothetical protein J1N35_011365 [Gossypium stocksii]|uniref:Aminotransferase-like plant mobile domain-containing protein n=1 Tax=Gossypium stocksii TaxID=47602 RepID=A0A9D3W3G1_9ROSI|nr:hypothetical protein J1N35_011365 [Gossypium stocksii]
MRMLLGAILDRINGGRIEMSWLRDTFPEPDDDSTELERIQYAPAYILEIIGGYLMPDLSRNLFQWTPYEDPAIQAIIQDEFFQNPNIWHVKVPMVTYAIVEMHQSDRVLRQFRFRQPIPVVPEKLDDEHKTDLRQLNIDWPRYWSDYIEIWKNRYDYIPTREPIIVPELAYVPEYMP